jgi:hypothetical protein
MKTIVGPSSLLFAITCALGSGCGGSEADLVISDTSGAMTTSGGQQGASGNGSSGNSGSAGATSGGSGSGGAGGAPCQESTWYCDGDKDSFGDDSVAVDACEAPAGGDAMCPGSYVASSNDCAPADAQGFPGQTMFFGSPLAPPVDGMLAFDYDCNGKEERDPAQLFKAGAADMCGFGDCFNPLDKPKGFLAKAACGLKTDFIECNSEFGQCTGVQKMSPEPLRCR